MNKFDLIEEVIFKTGMTRKEAELVVESFLDSVMKHLVDKEEVKITGFGTFSVRERQARNGTNPKTGEKIHIREAKTVGFKPCKKLKGSL